jgi:hypothetical protein
MLLDLELSNSMTPKSDLMLWEMMTIAILILFICYLIALIQQEMKKTIKEGVFILIAGIIFSLAILIGILL